MEEAVEKGTVTQKKRSEAAVNGKNTVPVDAVDELKGHRGRALHGVEITTGRTETAVAAERDKF